MASDLDFIKVYTDHRFAEELRTGPRDCLTARDCVVLDGRCDCPANPEGGVPNACKYLNKMR